MTDNIENDLGLQPIAGLMTEHGLKPNDLVRNSTEQLTHKMVSRALKGRRLTPNIKNKIINALNIAAGKEYKLKDLFNY
ncbi:MAG: hypothetical protein NTZ92_00295 [Candidatus Omnitrophica bacterium]|nr:hypothetical protein [Candidatus Omnitrophota bacterium]